MKANGLERTTSTTSVHDDHQEFTINQPSQGSLYRRDGCRAWLVCLSAVLSNIIIFGSTQTFGVIYPVLLDEFNEGKAKTAWVGSLVMSMSLTLSPIAAKLINRFGPRVVSIVGGLVCALGLFLTSFTTSIIFMYCTYGFIFGVGASMTFTSNFDIVSKYFKRRIALAMGIMYAGIGASFSMSPVIETLITHVGWRNTFKVLAGMPLLVCVCGMSFSQHVETDNEPLAHRRTVLAQDRVKRTPLLRNGRFILCCISNFGYQFGNNIPLTHLGRYARECGLTLSQVAYLYIGYGLSSMAGRVVSGRICDVKFINPIYVTAFVSLAIGISIMFIQFAKDFTGLILYFCVNGICDGAQVIAIAALVIRNTHALDRTRAFGWFLQITSFGILLGPPCGGFIADQVGSYIPAFYTSGSIILCSAGVAMTMKCFKSAPNITEPCETELILEEDLENSDMTVIERITVV